MVQEGGRQLGWALGAWRRAKPLSLSPVAAFWLLLAPKETGQAGASLLAACPPSPAQPISPHPLIPAPHEHIGGAASLPQALQG